MKNFFKKIIPVLLTALILVSIVWYCFIYDRNFTRDMLLGQARYNSTDGNPYLASWFYDRAYELSDQDDDVAIELANQFRKEGNFTKAEYTLTHAIADQPTAKLYQELCKVYVAQDKLLDAVNLLDNIPHAAIKAELDALRPNAPTIAPEPGFYTEYITVTLDVENGSVHYSTDAEYPSTKNISPEDGFVLPAGESSLRAITVSKNGLVSSVASANYTVGGVIEQVSFTDVVVDTAIRQMIMAHQDDILYSNMLWEITSFTVPEGAMNLHDLALLPYLQELIIDGQTFDSVDFLASLSNLKTLVLTDCRFPANELEIIGGLPALQNLTLSGCSLSTLSGLENARNLNKLDLSNNTVRNLEPLATLTELRELDLSHNAATNLSALSNLTNLETLNVAYNALTDVAPLDSCQNLVSLIANNNQISTLEGIAQLTNLTTLNLYKNSLTTVSDLANCTALVELEIGSNSIDNISALSSLTALEVFSFASNQVTSLPSWGENCKLRSIDGSYNQIKSLSPLKNMHTLTHVFMDYNQITSVDVIASCYNLVQVNVYGNAIESVDSLKEHEIIVNWDPTLAN